MPWLSIGKDGKVMVVGIDQPEADLVAQKGDLLVLKVPGHNYWSGRGEQSYAGAEFQIYRSTGDVSDDGHIFTDRVIDFPVRKERV